MEELNEAGLLAEFFVFLEEVGMMAVFEQMQLPGVLRMLAPTAQCVLLYLLKVLFGGQSMNELPRVLFGHLAARELVGFNARQVEEGFTKRGESQRKTKQKQGTLSPQYLANNNYLLTFTPSPSLHEKHGKVFSKASSDGKIPQVASTGVNA